MSTKPIVNIDDVPMMDRGNGKKFASGAASVR
jgi:hypothetical protein